MHKQNRQARRVQVRMKSTQHWLFRAQGGLLLTVRGSTAGWPAVLTALLQWHACMKRQQPAARAPGAGSCSWCLLSSTPSCRTVSKKAQSRSKAGAVSRVRPMLKHPTRWAPTAPWGQSCACDIDGGEGRQQRSTLQAQQVASLPCRTTAHVGAAQCLRGCLHPLTCIFI